jgi:adenylate cyclase
MTIMNDRTLLFVDDEPNVLSSLKRVLHNKPYRTLFAEGAQNALDLLKKETVDVVITDLRMPRMDGFELLQKVEEWYPDIVRLVLSGQVDSESILRAVNDGKIYAYIIKPVDELELTLVLGHAIDYFILQQEKRDLLKTVEKHNRILEKSVKELSKAAADVARGKYGDPLPVRKGDRFGQLFRSFNTMVKGLKERDFIRNTFGRYVDSDIAKALMKQPETARLGGERRVVIVLMSDVRDFTPLSESIDADAIISILNRYFSFAIEIVKKHHGIIVDFVGDGVLAFFDPMKGPITPSVRNAVCCALEMQRKMDNFNDKSRAMGLADLRIGIGLNAGEVVVGNIGSESRTKYSIVGAPVNMTQRIQSVARPGEVILSESLYDHIKERLSIRQSFQAQLKGVKGTNMLYVLDDYRDQPNNNSKADGI